MPTRPVQLQLNNSGSWKRLCDFDFDDPVAASMAGLAGHCIGLLGGARTTLRIASCDPEPVVMVRWGEQRRWLAEDSGQPWQFGVT